MPKIAVAAAPKRKGAGYPPPFDAPLADRIRERLGDAGGLTDFGVDLMRLRATGRASAAGIRMRTSSSTCSRVS